MAVRDYTIVQPLAGEDYPDGVRVVKWTGLLNGDTGAPYKLPHRPIMTVQATGTFGVGGTVTMEGSVDSAAAPSFSTMKEADGTAGTLATGAESMKQLLENVYQVRPNVTAGDGTTSLVVWMLINTMARR
jgi:hypothetical protein